MNLSSMDALSFWLVTLGLALGTYAFRTCFLVFIDNEKLPQWLLRHLNYTAVAILPALIAPMVVFPKDADVEASSIRAIAACFALFIGIWRGSVLLTIVMGMGCLYLLNYLGL